MKQYIILDISGKVEKYDNALFDALCRLDSKVTFRCLMPGKGLFSFIPKKIKNSENLFKRLIKVLEVLLNYMVICSCLYRKKPEVLHVQWLPLLEFVGWEIYIFKYFQKKSPSTKYVLTIHNIYPHNMSDRAKIAYNNRFRKISKMFDAFIVHTQNSKVEAVKDFALNDSNVYVCCHGVFEPHNVMIKTKKYIKENINILQFGNQSFYKGTDLLVDAICGLDERRKSMVSVNIVGDISPVFLADLKSRDTDSKINWIPYFLNDDKLYEVINNSDIIVLPYRAISQSGVLLLSIYFEKLIICSNLPSFIETMSLENIKELDDCLFFETENADSLRKLLIRYIDGNVCVDKLINRIKYLKKLYSWDSAAKSTLKVYE